MPVGTPVPPTSATVAVKLTAVPVIAEVGVALGPIEGDTRGITVFGALDNLVKGGAGQALQNLNLMLGLEELSGLSSTGIFP